MNIAWNAIATTDTAKWSSKAPPWPDWHLEAQMEKYLKGIRCYHPDDETGAKMRAMALRPESNEQLKDIIAHITTLSKEYPVQKMKLGATRKTTSNQE